MGNRGIRESGNPGIGESGNWGIRESGNPGIGESGNRGIRESGNHKLNNSHILIIAFFDRCTLLVAW